MFRVYLWLSPKERAVDPPKVGTTFQWTGSEKSIATEMVNAFTIWLIAPGFSIAQKGKILFNEWSL
jgi:hypothetical protein